MYMRSGNKRIGNAVDIAVELFSKLKGRSPAAALIVNVGAGAHRHGR